MHAGRGHLLHLPLPGHGENGISVYLAVWLGLSPEPGQWDEGGGDVPTPRPGREAIHMTLHGLFSLGAGHTGQVHVEDGVLPEKAVRAGEYSPGAEPPRCHWRCMQERHRCVLDSCPEI